MASEQVNEIPINLELLSSDNRIGVLLAVGCASLWYGLSDWLGWAEFFQPNSFGSFIVRPFLLIFGIILIFKTVHRLLTPGCRPVIRINFGGVTDVRLVTAPIRWSFIVNAYRPKGVWHYLLPGVILEMDSRYHSTGLETIWSYCVHFHARSKGRRLLFLECGTLDQNAEQLLMSIQSHLRERERSGRY